METNKKLMQKIKKVWKEQEELLEATHKKIAKVIKNFSYKDLKDIFQDEEMELYTSREDFESIEEKGGLNSSQP